jgi:hypothetical protein
VAGGQGTLELALEDLDTIGGVLDACARAADADTKLDRLRRCCVTAADAGVRDSPGDGSSSP